MIHLSENTIEEGTMDIKCDSNTNLHLNLTEGKLSAAVEKDNKSFCVKSEYMKAFDRITNTQILGKFFQNAFVKINQLSNGDFKFDVNQKANGGGGGGSKEGGKDSSKSGSNSGNKGGGKFFIGPPDRSGGVYGPTKDNGASGGGSKDVGGKDISKNTHGSENKGCGKLVLCRPERSGGLCGATKDIIAEKVSYEPSKGCYEGSINAAIAGAGGGAVKGFLTGGGFAGAIKEGAGGTVGGVAGNVIKNIKEGKCRIEKVYEPKE